MDDIRENVAAEAPEAEPATAEQASEPEYKALWQRAVADLENARKRFDSERAATIKFGQQSLIEELLPVVDNFYRATSHVPAEQQSSPWVTGIQYIQKNLLDVLAGYGVTEAPVKPGDAYDASAHEAIGTVASSEILDQHVVEVVNRGSRIYDRLLRPASVIVSTGAPADAK